MHTVVLGNGIVALSTAFRLVQRWTAQSTDTLTVVGRFARPGSATLAAAAMFNSFAEIEAGSLDHPLDLYRFELSHLATQMWPDFERALIAAAGEALPAGCPKLKPGKKAVRSELLSTSALQYSMASCATATWCAERKPSMLSTVGSCCLIVS